MGTLSNSAVVDLYAGFPEEVIERLEALAHSKTFFTEEILFREGAYHDGVHFVISGQVQLDMLVPDRGRIPIQTIGAGEWLGWSPMFGEHSMTATAVALETVQTKALNGRELRNLCSADHDVGYFLMRALLQTMSQRLVSTRRHLLKLLRESLPAIGDSVLPDLGQDDLVRHDQ